MTRCVASEVNLNFKFSRFVRVLLYTVNLSSTLDVPPSQRTSRVLRTFPQGHVPLGKVCCIWTRRRRSSGLRCRCRASSSVVQRRFSSGDARCPLCTYVRTKRGVCKPFSRISTFLFRLSLSPSSLAISESPDGSYEIKGGENRRVTEL